MKNRIKRIFTSNIYLLLVLSAVLINKYEYILSVIFIEAVIATREYFNVCDIKKKKFFMILGYVISLLYFLSGIFLKTTLKYSLEILTTGFIISGIYLVLNYSKMEYKEFTLAIAAYIYIPFILSFIPELFLMKNGNILYLFLMFITMSTDAFAYIIGSIIGKHKLTKLSPKKSIEGSVSGTLSAVIVSTLLYFILQKFNIFLNINIFVLMILSLFVSVISQFGDLFASFIKREFNKKDFGKILLGHGGFLDRIDSLLFTAPTFYIILKLFFKM